jgi:hypothetical protein
MSQRSCLGSVVGVLAPSRRGDLGPCRRTSPGIVRRHPARPALVGSAAFCRRAYRHGHYRFRCWLFSLGRLVLHRTSRGWLAF